MERNDDLERIASRYIIGHWRTRLESLLDGGQERPGSGDSVLAVEAGELRGGQASSLGTIRTKKRTR